MEQVALVGVVALAMVFSYTNGFHDSANAIATSVSTRALTPRIALLLAAGANLLGAFFGVRVAETIGSGIVDATGATLPLCAGALIGAIGWNMLTWWRGLPSSSSHALIGGLVGAAAVGGVGIQWRAVLERVVLPMLVSPVIGLLLGWGLMTAITWVFRRGDARRVGRGFRYAQTVSATAMAFGHGMQDAAKVAGIVVLALIADGRHAPEHGDFVPLWVVLLSGVVMSVGTYAGGWRIMRTLGRRLIALTPPQGFAAETAAAITLAVATAFRAPISSTYAITAAIMGAGTARNVRQVRWDVGRDIALAWVATLPGAALAAAAAHGILRLVG
ncbi:MAG TPA: inorganic phosphate transporter [Phycicoccus sp.]|nr:inorganic phosphate transporter [Phycicoccus sp.]